MSTKYIAKHDGHTWKRTTANRTYTHAVIGKGNLAAERAAQIEGSIRQFERDLPYYKGIVAGTEPDYTQTPERIAAAKASIEGGTEAVAARAASWFDTKFLPKVKLASDGVSFYYATANWAGRPDLAQKAAKPGDIILVAEVVS